MSGKSKQIYLKNGRGFFNDINISDFNGIRTLVIEDKEVSMTDKEPTSTVALTFNDQDQENVKQMKELAYTILEMIGEKDSNSIEFGKWLFHTDNGTEHFDHNLEKKSESIGYSPYNCVMDGTITIEALFKIWNATIKKTD